MAKKKLLNKKQAEVIEQHRKWDIEQGRAAAFTVWEQIENYLKDERRSKDKESFKNHRRFSFLAKEQIDVLFLTSCDKLHPPESIGDAILRRFTFDSPEEFAVRISISARYEFSHSQWSGNSKYEDLFRPILQAAGARDFDAAEHMVNLVPEKIEKPSDRMLVPLCEAVCALVRQDIDQMRESVSQFRKSLPSYPKAIGSVIAAVADHSPEDFATALNKMLSGYKRYMFDDDLYGLIDPHAIGIYELSRKMSPEVVSEFDVTRKLPWDREYFEWLQSVEDIAEYLQADKIPAEVRPYLMDFKEVPFAAEVRANWHQS